MSDMIPQTGTQPRYESNVHETFEDINLSRILGCAVAIVMLCLVSAGLLAGVMSYAQVGVDREQALRPAVFSRSAGLYGEAGPAVKGENPVSDYRRDPGSVPDLLAADQALSPSAYGWTQPGKVARIPVDRAISILSEKGLLSQPAFSVPSPEPSPADAVRRARENPAPQPPVPNAIPGK